MDVDLWGNVIVADDNTSDGPPSGVRSKNRCLIGESIVRELKSLMMLSGKGSRYYTLTGFWHSVFVAYMID